MGGDTDIIKCLLDGVSVKQKVELLRIQDIDDHTVIQEAAKANQTEILSSLESADKRAADRTFQYCKPFRQNTLRC
ncbi:hypothetical protein EB796_007632 [Bugula neritina]|uniref:Uncharacterized protein n=1 Tax=Bugula neritina TaxID=10212 RepID=A0A7J7K620_BUGNE|nr:hypothetical protein EB796_007632 [Bugula neritina]